MAHGYARDYDEGWDRNDDRDRERSEREYGDRNRERERGWMFGDDDRDRDRNRDEGHSWFGDEDRGDRVDRGAWENNRDWPQSRAPMGGREQGRSRLSSHPDDHYRSWRERQMEALDRDYEEYCRECEQQFHRDFDDWRSKRGQGSQASGSGQSGGQSRSTEEAEYMLEQTRAEAPGAGNTPSPTSEATLGTNNSENTGKGRARK